MTVFEEVVNFLNGANVPYRVLDHEPVFTSEQAAKIRGTEASQGAKALIVYADGRPIMLVLPGNRKVDFKKFKLGFMFRDLRMATPEEVEKLAGVKIGAVHPLGNLAKMSLYVDSQLGKSDEIAFNAGLHEKSIIMKYKDYERLCSPTVSDFSVVKG